MSRSYYDKWEQAHAFDVDSEESPSFEIPSEGPRVRGRDWRECRGTGGWSSHHRSGESQ